MQDLITQIKQRENELWYLYLALEELKVKSPWLFQEQDFSRLRGTCKYILDLIGKEDRRV